MQTNDNGIYERDNREYGWRRILAFDGSYGDDANAEEQSDNFLAFE